jgi:dienelactone hydrolase
MMATAHRTCRAAPFVLALLLLIGLCVHPSSAIAQTSLPPARLYSFGEAEITQAWLPRRDANRTMPYRIEGIIALPEGAGPFPVVFIFHAAHGGCPIDASIPDSTRETWPCPSAAEQRNDVGLTYLVSALAARGYVAVAPNLNAVYASAFGAFGPEVRRYPDVFEAHLNGLIRANREDTDALDVSLVGKLDLARIGMVGHGHGSLLAMQSARARTDRGSRSDAAEGNGPLIGTLLVAPLYSLEGDADIPLSVILPSCDGIATDLNGQGYYEDARLDKSREHFAASVYLVGANHNAFNEVVKDDDAEALTISSGCQSDSARAAREGQRGFLAQYAPDFFDVALGNDEAASQAGLNPNAGAPFQLYGQLVQTALAVPGVQRSIIIQPRMRDDLGYNGFGGYATTSGPAEVEFCEYRRLCGRWPLSPGNPSQARFAWTTTVSAQWEMPLDDEGVDVSQYDALHLRAALDPSDYLNAHRKRQSLRLTLTDMSGRSASVTVDDTSPALAYPPGGLNLRAWGWAGHAFLNSVRVPILSFRGIDLVRVRSLTLSPSGDLSGSLFVADVEFIRPAAQ